MSVPEPPLEHQVQEQVPSAAESTGFSRYSALRPQAEHALEQLRDIVNRLGAPITQDTSETHDKLTGVERSVSELRRLSVPIPAELSALLDSLRGRVREVDEAREVATYIHAALVEITAQLRAFLPGEPVRHGRTSRAGVHAGERLRAAHSRPRGYVLSGTHHDAATWTDLLRDVAAYLAAKHPDRFEQVLSLQWRDKPWYGRDSSLFIRPALVPGTDVYVNIPWRPTDIAALAAKTAEVLGYGPDEFTVLDPE